MAHDDEAFELAATVVQAGIEGVEAASDGLSVPGVDLAATLIRRAIEARNRAKAKEFFQRLAVATGSSDPEALALDISKSIDKPWAQEGSSVVFAS